MENMIWAGAQFWLCIIIIPGENLKTSQKIESLGPTPGDFDLLDLGGVPGKVIF
jgi:hypothetical protein